MKKQKSFCLYLIIFVLTFCTGLLGVADAANMVWAEDELEIDIADEYQPESGQDQTSNEGAEGKPLVNGDAQAESQLATNLVPDSEAAGASDDQTDQSTDQPADLPADQAQPDSNAEGVAGEELLTPPEGDQGIVVEGDSQQAKDALDLENNDLGQDNSLVMGEDPNSILGEQALRGEESNVSLPAIYLNGQSGNDEHDGSSEELAVKTFARAKELAAEHPTVEKIIVTGTVPKILRPRVGQYMRIKPR